MGQTMRRAPVFEIAIGLEDCAPHTAGTKERKLAGDIIAIRRPHTEIGSAETSRYLWLRLEGLEENDMARLTDGIEQDGEAFDKRRYCIPLHRLKAVVPSFSIPRALDPGDRYQPFLTIDEDGPHTFLTTARPLRVEGLVFDKLTGGYL